MDYSNIFPIEEYYRRVVMPLDKKFKVVKGDKFICCLHDDNDPSMGIIKSKKKGELFHCFGGCGSGTVVDLHKRVSLIYFKKRLDEESAIRELCSIFEKDYSSIPQEDVVNISDRYVLREMAIQESLTSFDISDFRHGIIDGKMEGKGVDYFNSLMVKMIDKLKED